MHRAGQISELLQAEAEQRESVERLAGQDLLVKGRKRDFVLLPELDILLQHRFSPLVAIGGGFELLKGGRNIAIGNDPRPKEVGDEVEIGVDIEVGLEQAGVDSAVAQIEGIAHRSDRELDVKLRERDRGIFTLNIEGTCLRSPP